MNLFEKEYYESDAFWSEGAITDSGNMARINAIIDLIPNDVKLLADIGCGNGVFIKELTIKRGDIKSVGIDRSVKALKYVDGEKLVGDISDIPTQGDSYDCVTCLQVLEHIPTNSYSRALSELSRVSRQYIIIGVPYKEKIEQNVTECPQCKTIFNVDLHLRSYNDFDIENLFKTYDFNLVNKINVVKIKEYVLLTAIIKIKGYFSEKEKKSFKSPICPLCGFKNSSFEMEKGTNATISKSNSLSKYLRTIIEKISPTINRNGYWIIALYEKNSK
jgi:SAM-dependent methyltransferase